MRDRQRVLIYQAFQKRLEQRHLKELYDYSMFSSLRDSWNDLEQQDFMIGVGAMQKALTRHEVNTEEDSFNVQEEIQAFEGKGYELGSEIVSAIGMKQNEKLTDKRKDKRKESIGIKDSTKKAIKSDGVSNATIVLQEGKAYLDEIKARITRAEHEKDLLEQQKRKEYFEHQEKEKEIEETRKKAEEEEYLKKQCEATLQLEAAHAEEEALIQQRMLIEQEIAEQRAQEWEAVLARDRELLLMLREDCAKEISHEKKLWQEEKKMKMEKRRTKHMNMCSELVLQIASLAESVAWYQECTNCVLPNFDWREWKNLFIKGVICPYSLHNLQSGNNLPSVADGTLFDKTMIMDYLQEEGEWKGVEEIGKNKDLGKILSEILDIACSPRKPLPDSVLSKLKLKLAVVGGPFSGKTSLAKKMENQFDLARIDIKDLISNAIQAVDADETQIPEDVNAKVDLGLEQEQVQPSVASQKVVLGREAKSALQQGLQIPDATVVELFMLTINCLGGQGKAIPSIQDAEKKNKTGTTLSAQRTDKKKPLDRDDDMEKDEYMPGFILDGFPNTVEQAEILEKELTGFDMKDVALKSSRTSLIAPPPELEHEQKFSSGFDGIFIIEPLDEMEAFKRGVARRVDPKTGITYNLEFDPPPQNDKTLMQLMIVGKLLLHVMIQVMFHWIVAWQEFATNNGRILKKDI